jgi:hypothetical protein
MASYDVTPVDTQETEVPPGFEVASPVFSMMHTPDVQFNAAVGVAIPVNARIMDWYVRDQTEQSLAALQRRQQTSAGSSVIKQYTYLLLHWFNSKTLTWVPIKSSKVVEGQLTAAVSAEVLNNPAFSGKLANMLVTTTEPPEVPECSEFQQLVSGVLSEHPLP